MGNVIFEFVLNGVLYLVVSCFCFWICVSSGNGNETMLVNWSDCGDAQQMVDECFKDLPPHLMEFLQTTKIAVNEQEIVTKCIVFKRGMTCFDNYTTQCLSNEKFILFKNNVAGARRFLSKFCEDRTFQADYLKHKHCFTHIQDDWKKCGKRFQEILTEELYTRKDGNHNPRNVSSKFMQFCCARHAYENCIYNSARFKCYKQSAKFARHTASMLSEEIHFSNCRQYEHVLCTSDGKIHLGHSSALASLLFWPLIQFIFL